MLTYLYIYQDNHRLEEKLRSAAVCHQTKHLTQMTNIYSSHAAEASLFSLLFKCTIQCIELAWVSIQ